MKLIHEQAIDMTDPATVTYWAAELGVDEPQLRSAVADVGAMPGALETFLADGAPGTSTTIAERESFQRRMAERYVRDVRPRTKRRRRARAPRRRIRSSRSGRTAARGWTFARSSNWRSS